MQKKTQPKIKTSKLDAVCMSKSCDSRQ